MSNLNVNTKSKKKAGLGRGLGSLLGENTQEKTFSPDHVGGTRGFDDEIELPSLDDEVPSNDEIIKTNKGSVNIDTENRIFSLDIEKIKPNKSQPRKQFDEQKLSELALSIKQTGVIQPILVRRIDPNSYEIIAGERRWRASQKAGLKQIPVIIKKYENKEVLEVALIENIQRSDLNPIEEAEAIKFLIQDHELTQDDVAKRLGKERSSITNLLRLLLLAPKVKSLVLENKISMGQAKVLLSVTEWADQEKLAKIAAEEKVSVRELENKVKMLKLSALKSSAEPKDSAELLNLKLVKGLGNELQKLLGQKVKIDYKKGRGKINIAFHSDDELNAVVNKIRKSWK